MPSCLPWSNGRCPECPTSPGAWLVTVGKRRWFDTLRRKGVLEGKQADLTRQAEVRQQLTGADFDDVETKRSATTGCGSFSPPAIRCFHEKPG